MRSKQLGQLLLENGDIQTEHLAKALKMQDQQGGLVGQILRANGACDENAVAAALLKQVQVTDIPCDEVPIAGDVADLIPRDICETDRLCPFERLGNLLCVVMTNPLNRKAINTIEDTTRLKVKPFKAIWPKIKELIERGYQAGQEPAAEDAGAAGGEVFEESPPIEPLPEPEPQPQAEGEAEQAPAAVEEATPEMPVEEAPAPAPEPVAEPEAAPAISPQQQASATRRRAANIVGLDNLDDSRAEVIHADRRGLSQEPAQAASATPKPGPRQPKVAKVNIDLDSFDAQAATEVVRSVVEEEHLEEINLAAPEEAAKPAQEQPAQPAEEQPAEEQPAEEQPAEEQPAEEAAATEEEGAAAGLSAFGKLPLSYFFEEGEAPESPEEQPEELADLLRQLPVAEVLAETPEEYRAALEEEREATAAEGEAAAAAGEEAPAEEEAPAVAERALPVHCTPAPLEPVLAQALTDREFDLLVKTRNMEADPMGEWVWNYSSEGPLPAVEYVSEAS
jgi:hypothetical protein